MLRWLQRGSRSVGSPAEQWRRQAPPPPTVDELARALGMTPAQVREMGRRYERWVNSR